ncbi:unnamed protein product, partial [Rodentolepis nana]|uniref:Uncharacterized protein n=1 Tax=Rodentolepis nana TaxID=102285 RepID=A0A0R3U0E0_RODNA
MLTETAVRVVLASRASLGIFDVLEESVIVVGLKEPGQPPVNHSFHKLSPGQPPVNHSFHKFRQHACEGDMPIVVRVARAFALYSTGITMATFH